MDVIKAKILLRSELNTHKFFSNLILVNFEKGKSYWKFNNSLLKDQKYVSEIKDLIKFIKLNYVQLNEYITENNINAIPDEQVRFSISDQLFSDIFLMEIRGETSCII